MTHDDAVTAHSDSIDVARLLQAVASELQRTDRQIDSLEGVVAAIVEGSELVSTDDEHDPEGTTIAYERAQATALLRQARVDRDALLTTRRRLESGEHLACATCGQPIAFERLLALPSASRCISCAT